MGSGIDEVLTMTRSSTTYYYHYDGLNSVRNITNSSGTVLESYTYDPYGNITSSLSSIGNPYYFTGRRFDSESGVYYYRARMYDPEIGRFLQRDPLEYWDSMNLYEYVLNNPINWTDPSGLKSDPRVKGVASEVVGRVINYAVGKLKRGRLRGALKMAGGAFTTASGVFFGQAAIAAGVMAAGSPEPLSKLGLGAAAIGFGGLAAWQLKEGYDQLNDGWDEIENPQEELDEDGLPAEDDCNSEEYCCDASPEDLM